MEEAAEAIVTERLRAAPDADTAAGDCSRMLASLQRYPEALTQFESADRSASRPSRAPWLTSAPCVWS